MSVSTPVLAYVAALMAGTDVGQSSSLTVTVNITGNWEVQIPVKVQFSNVSSDPVVKIYPSSDGGANYDSVPTYAFAIPRVSTAANQSSIRIPTGIYALQLINSGPNTATFMVLTQQVLTGINIA